MVLGQHRRMWLEAMRQTEQRVYGFGSLKDGYALVGIHLRKQKCCLKKGTTSMLVLSPRPHHPGFFRPVHIAILPAHIGFVHLHRSAQLLIPYPSLPYLLPALSSELKSMPLTELSPNPCEASWLDTPLRFVVIKYKATTHLRNGVLLLLHYSSSPHTEILSAILAVIRHFMLRPGSTSPCAVRTMPLPVRPALILKPLCRRSLIGKHLKQFHNPYSFSSETFQGPCTSSQTFLTLLNGVLYLPV